MKPKTKKIFKPYTTTKLTKNLICKVGATGLTNELTSLDGKFTVKFAENSEKFAETVENKIVENKTVENKTVENKEPQAIIKTDYLRELLTMNIEQREQTVSRLCWSKEWVEQYYGYNSDCIINGIMSELITFMWLNSNKFCKYFEVKYGNLFMVEGSKLFKLQNQPDIKIFFEDRVMPTEIKSTTYAFNFNETDKPSMTIPQLINKAHREHAELLFVLDVVNLKLIIVDIINDKFIECCDVKNMYSRLLKVLLDNNSLNRILGLKGHVIE